MKRFGGKWPFEKAQGNPEGLAKGAKGAEGSGRKRKERKKRNATSKTAQVAKALERSSATK